MRRSLAKFSKSEASNHAPSSADFTTTTTPELKFSVHTMFTHGSFNGFRGYSHQWPFAGLWRVAESPLDRPLPWQRG
jgi:hypothetical protein